MDGMGHYILGLFDTLLDFKLQVIINFTEVLCSGAGWLLAEANRAVEFSQWCHHQNIPHFKKLVTNQTMFRRNS